MPASTADVRGVIVSCSGCGRRNRLAWNRIDQAGRCGACGVSLAAPSEPIAIDDERVFTAATLEAALPVLVDFWAPWCGPCRAVAPAIAQVAGELAGRALVVKVDTESAPAIAGRHRIQSIPTLAVFHRGQVLARESGARPAAAIRSFVLQAIGARVS